MALKTDYAIGTPAAWAKGMCRIAVTLPDATFEQVKISAMRENRSMAAEIRTRIERTLRDDRSKE